MSLHFGPKPLMDQTEEAWLEKSLAYFVAASIIRRKGFIKLNTDEEIWKVSIKLKKF